MGALELLLATNGGSRHCFDDPLADDGPGEQQTCDWCGKLMQSYSEHLPVCTAVDIDD